MVFLLRIVVISSTFDGACDGDFCPLLVDGFGNDVICPHAEALHDFIDVFVKRADEYA